MIKDKGGFTLIEILVVILIIAIMALGVSNYNFGALSDKQRLEAFGNTVVAEIETIRTNALVGRGVEDTFEVADHWEMEFTKNGNGSITTKYYIKEENSDVLKGVIYNTLTPPTGFSISKIICGYQEFNNSEIAKIILKGNEYSLDGNCLKDHTSLSINLLYKTYIKTINFNTVNGLVSVEK